MASATTTEQSRYGSSRRDNHHRHQEASAAADLSLREWGLRSRISHENTKSRRFSGSHITSFREDAASFRSNFTISSTASSPGYPLKDEIDPSTYSFTTALKALQARSGYNSWECLSPDGFALNSKWNEAEKYICNPLSGQVPMECLSAKTLSGRSFRNSTSNRITMSAPLVYSSSYNSKKIFTKPTSLEATPNHPDIALHSQTQEKKIEGLTMTTRDVGTQSTPPDELSSSSLSPASTPPIIERCLKRCDLAEGGDSPHCNGKLMVEGKVEDNKETKGKEEARKAESEEEKRKVKQEDEEIWMCSRRRRSMQGGCLSWMRKRQREKHKPRKIINFLLNLEGC